MNSIIKIHTIFLNIIYLTIIFICPDTFYAFNYANRLIHVCLLLFLLKHPLSALYRFTLLFIQILLIIDYYIFLHIQSSAKTAIYYTI